jgi:hypothetical protein
MLAGGSVGAGWDQLQRAGPKDDRQVTVGSERWSETNREDPHCEDAMEAPHCEDAKSLHEEMVTDFLVRWHISRMTAQDRQVSRPDMVIQVDDIAQTNHAHAVHPAPTAFRLAAATETAIDPRSSACATYSTVFSGYAPGGLYTGSPPIVAAPWTSVSALYAPYDSRTKHFLSLRVSRTLAPVPTSSATSLHTRYTGASTLPPKQPITPNNTYLPHAQHGGDEPKRDTPTTDATTDATAAPLASPSVMDITDEKKGQPQGGAQLERDTATSTHVAPLSSALAMITSAKTCQPQGGVERASDRKGTPTPVAPQSSALAMITPVNTCPSQGVAELARDSKGTPTPAAPKSSDSKRYISPASTCLSQGGAGLERDCTAAPTPAAPLSPRETVIKSDRQARPTAASSRSAPAVNGDATLSCSSPPHFSEMNIPHVKKCHLHCGTELERSTTTPTLATPLSSAFAMLTSVKTCQPEGGAELERDSKGAPTTTDPQSCDSERNILLTSTCQSQGGGSDLERRMSTPTLADPLSSALARSTPGKTCQSQGGTHLE